MRNRKGRRFRHRSNGRGHQSHINGSDKPRLMAGGFSNAGAFSNGRIRNNFYSRQSAEKLVEKYNTLAKEALTSGDKILSENYLQHVDHFVRIIDDRNLNRNQNKDQTDNKTSPAENNLVEGKEVKQDNIDKEKKE